jgi:phosphoglycolate phosphatase
MQKPATIIFDFDGTIADSFETVVSIVHDMIRPNQPVTTKEIVALRHMSLIDIAKREHIAIWRVPFLLMRGRRMMSQRLGEVKLFTGIDLVIKQLHKDGYKLLIMSSNSPVNIKKFLRSYDLDKYFLKIYGGAGLFGKARLLRRILRLNGLSAKNCVYIGDELRDIEASKEVDMLCISVGWGFTARSKLAQHQVLVVAQKPKELPAIIKQLAL